MDQFSMTRPHSKYGEDHTFVQRAEHYEMRQRRGSQNRSDYMNFAEILCESRVHYILRHELLTHKWEKYENEN